MKALNVTAVEKDLLVPATRKAAPVLSTWLTCDKCQSNPSHTPRTVRQWCLGDREHG